METDSAIAIPTYFIQGIAIAIATNGYRTHSIFSDIDVTITMWKQSY